MTSHQDTEALQALIARDPDGLEQVFLKYRIDPGAISPYGVVMAYRVFGLPFLDDLYGLWMEGGGKNSKPVSELIGFGSGRDRDRSKFADFFDRLSGWVRGGSAVMGAVNTNIVNPRQTEGCADCQGEDCGGCADHQSDEGPEPERTILGINRGMFIAGVIALVLIIGFIIYRSRK